MNPAAILALANLCTERYHEPRAETGHLVSNFLGAWCAWEALRSRLIRVIIHKRGWLVKDADAALKVARLSSMKGAAHLLCRLGLPDPSHWKGVGGQTWRTLLSIEPLRHRLTHGFRTADPELIRLATAVVLEAVMNHQWLEDLGLPDEFGNGDVAAVGRIMVPRNIHAQRDRRSKQELFELLEIHEGNGKSSLPSKSRLEAQLRKMQGKV